MKRILTFITLCAFLSACYRVPRQIEPSIASPPHPKEIQREKRSFLALPVDFSISPFPSLTTEECSSDWGKEYRIALSFADDFDLYRAVTGFKRALYLLPSDQTARKLEIEYAIALAYYLGKKYVESAYAVEATGLVRTDETFPAFSDLLLILYDSYCQLGKEEHAAHVLKLIETQDTAVAQRLTLLSAVKAADFATISEAGNTQIVAGYQKGSKSIGKAQFLNAMLPGAGYWYVGQKSTAITALIVNSLFIGAAAHFFTSGNTAAGIITLSFEGGWYFGGIYGSGLAAKYYNERLYCDYACKITQREQLFPIMMLKYTF